MPARRDMTISFWLFTYLKLVYSVLNLPESFTFHIFTQDVNENRSNRLGFHLRVVSEQASSINKNRTCSKDTWGEREEEQGIHHAIVSLINKFWINGSWLEAFISNNEDPQSQKLDVQVFGQGPLHLKIHRDIIYLSKYKIFWNVLYTIRIISFRSRILVKPCIFLTKTLCTHTNTLILCIVNALW